MQCNKTPHYEIHLFAAYSKHYHCAKFPFKCRHSHFLLTFACWEVVYLLTGDNKCMIRSVPPLWWWDIYSKVQRFAGMVGKIWHYIICQFNRTHDLRVAACTYLSISAECLKCSETSQTAQKHSQRSLPCCSFRSGNFRPPAMQDLTPPLWNFPVNTGGRLVWTCHSHNHVMYTVLYDEEQLLQVYLIHIYQLFPPRRLFTSFPSKLVKWKLTTQSRQTDLSTLLLSSDSSLTTLDISSMIKKTKTKQNKDVSCGKNVRFKRVCRSRRITSTSFR